MQICRLDHDVVLPIEIVRGHAEWILRTDVADVGRAQSAILSGQSEAPLPLLSDNLDLGRIFRDRDELAPDNKARSQHGCHSYSCGYGQPPFEPLVLRLVCRAPSF